MKEISKRENGTISVKTINKDDSLTQQQFRDDCDVNIILKKLIKGNYTVPLNHKNGVYGDFSNIPSFMEAQNTVAKAKQAFMELPSGIRTRFANDPQNLMDFLNDSKNAEEGIKLGLLTKPIQPPPNEAIENLKEINKTLKETNQLNKKTKQKNDE